MIGRADRSRLEPILAIAMIALAGGAAAALAPMSRSHHSPGLHDSLRAHLASYFERASHVWDPDPWTYSDDDSSSWKQKPMPSLPEGLRLQPPFLRDAAPNWGSEAEECSLTVWRRFLVGGDTIAFTMGRAPESCSEAPRMIWVDPEQGRLRRVIPPLFNWNVDAFWSTERYLIFGLVADYEGGEHDERLAFWRLGDGRIVVSPGVAWNDSGRAVLPGWREARVGEAGEALVVIKSDTTLAFWPAQRSYSAAVRSVRSHER